MKAVFGDTFFYIALLNRQDAFHDGVLEHTRIHNPRIVTTEWVWTEVADAFCAAAQRRSVLPAWNTLRSDPDTVVVPSSSALFERGLELYHERPDKDWSLTDCISFVVMSDHGLSEALTGDRHFEQAGYTAIFAGA